MADLPSSPTYSHRPRFFATKSQPLKLLPCVYPQLSSSTQATVGALVGAEVGDKVVGLAVVGLSVGLSVPIVDCPFGLLVGTAVAGLPVEEPMVVGLEVGLVVPVASLGLLVVVVVVGASVE